MLVLSALAVLATAPQVNGTQDAKVVVAAQESVPAHLKGAAAARKAAVAWLAAHQDEDGKWDSDAFAKHDSKFGRGTAKDEEDVLWDDRWLDEKPKPRRSGGDTIRAWTDQGDPNHDIGVTGLALLALIADGNTMTRGEHKDAVKRGVRWLCDNQSRETGLIGEEVGHTFLYDHGIASLALCQVCAADGSIVVKERAQAAVNYIARARNPYAVWRYDVPPVGDNDTSISTWMILAVEAAMRADLKIDAQSFLDAGAWLDEMTDPKTGRVGYTETGSPSSRVPGINVQYPTENHETLTAAALYVRLTMGQRPAAVPVMIDYVRLILRAVPEAPPKSIDDALWVFYGTRATSWLGGKPWQLWSEAFIPAVVATQSKEGPTAGSWDPKNAWGYSMGRVGTTALMAWTLASIDGAPSDGAKMRDR